MVTTVGTGEASGTMPFVKCTTSAWMRRRIRGACVCIHTRRGDHDADTSVRTCAGSGRSVATGRLEITVSASSCTLGGRVPQQVLGVVADACSPGSQRRSVKRDVHAVGRPARTRTRVQA